MEQTADNQHHPEAPWHYYATAVLVLILALFLLNVAETQGTTPIRQTEADLENLRSGDQNVKRYFSSLNGRVRKNISKDKANSYLTDAFRNYSQAAQRPSPAAIRRTGVLAYELERKDVLQTFDRLDSKVVLKDASKLDIQDLKAEVSMWQDIYASKKPLNSKKLDSYRRRIQSVSLGPVKTFALVRLYERADQPAQAQRALSLARERATFSLNAYNTLSNILIIFGVIGVILLIRFFGKQQRPSGPPITTPDMTATNFGPTTPPASEESITPEQVKISPELLFKGFIAYLVVSIALGIIFSLATESYLDTLPREKRVLSLVGFEFASTALGGLIALALVQMAVRKMGGNLAAIGLTARNFWSNVMWGIGGYCALLPILLIASLIWRILSRTIFQGIETPVNPVVPLALAGNTAAFIGVFIVGTVLAPIFEEIFFRGMLYSALRARLSFAIAAILSSVAFALMHPFPGGFTPIFAIGVVFAILREVRQSLVPSIVAHAINNAVQFLMIYFISVAQIRF
jgi:membrane protease YdiL (CAAX protease family)